jgi:hypothetical protein
VGAPDRQSSSHQPPVQYHSCSWTHRPAWTRTRRRDGEEYSAVVHGGWSWRQRSGPVNPPPPLPVLQQEGLGGRPRRQEAVARARDSVVSTCTPRRCAPALSLAFSTRCSRHARARTLTQGTTHSLLIMHIHSGPGRHSAPNSKDLSLPVTLQHAVRRPTMPLAVAAAPAAAYLRGHRPAHSGAACRRCLAFISRFCSHAARR